MIDGMQVTSTTMHVLGAKEDMQMRKQQLQDLRRLQREEARQKQELQAEGINLAEQQDRKFQQEKIVIFMPLPFYYNNYLESHKAMGVGYGSLGKEAETRNRRR